MRCENCNHWKKSEHSELGYGVCGKIKDASEDDLRRMPASERPLAYIPEQTDNGLTVMTEYMTQAGYGCKLFRHKPFCVSCKTKLERGDGIICGESLYCWDCHARGVPYGEDLL